MSIKRFDGNTNIRDEDGTLLIGMMIRRLVRQNTVTVTSSATKIPTNPLSKRLSILIINIGTEAVYLGDSTVTTANGYPIYPRGAIRFDIEDGIDIYGIASTSAEMRILEAS